MSKTQNYVVLTTTGEPSWTESGATSCGESPANQDPPVHSVWVRQLKNLQFNPYKNKPDAVIRFLSGTVQNIQIKQSDSKVIDHFDPEQNVVTQTWTSEPSVVTLAQVSQKTRKNEVDPVRG